jgi:hypothetical protein
MKAIQIFPTAIAVAALPASGDFAAAQDDQSGTRQEAFE